MKFDEGFQGLYRELEHHNDWCYRTAKVIGGLKMGTIKYTTMEDAEAIRQKCVAYGMGICSAMRQNGFDVVVDTLSGWVSDRSLTDMEELRADGEKRYLAYMEEYYNE